MNNFLEKRIKDMENYTFEIPEYQRGYRWEKTQVKYLLNDIYNCFKQNREKGNKSYYLQPIIIKSIQENQIYTLIDGQQRLTTIYMIIMYFNKKYSQNNYIYKFKYKTLLDGNKKIDLENTINQLLINKNVEYENLNDYYYHNALEEIDEWTQNNIKTTEVNDFLKFIKSNIKLLWYELEDEDENRVFFRINTNKIKLTQGDLVKAEFLRQDLDRKNMHCSIDELGKDWDKIENNLFNEPFWYFISKKDTDDRMTKLLSIAIKMEKDNKRQAKDDENEIYNIYAKEIADDYDETWKKIKNAYYILNEWYNDIDIYNLIGFITSTTKKEEDIENFLAEAMKEYIMKKDKECFKKYFLLDEIKKQVFKESLLKDIKDVENNKGQVIKKLSDYITDLDYNKNKEEIKTILLLHNIFTLNKLKEDKLKFAFEKYNNLNKDDVKQKIWEIEHIHSQHDKDINNESDKNAYIDYLKNYVINESIKNNDFSENLADTLRKIEELRNIDLKNKKLKDEGKEIVNIDENFEPNQIGNLTLLDSNINRSYQDSLFMKKRKEIIKRDENSFVPICTKKVFLKAYNVKEENEIQEENESLQFFEWNTKDAEIYTADIINKIYEALFNMDGRKE